MEDEQPSPALPLDNEQRLMIEELVAGRNVSDRAFDSLFPEPVRKASSRFWTPVAVARRVASLFASSGANRVLDVGAGPGKFCLIGALTTEMVFHGIEHRRRLVAVARRLSATLGVDRAIFFEGELDDIDWQAYDAFYFYNPFEENLFAEEHRLDNSAPCSATRFRTDIAKVEALLDEARVGTRVATFQGLQGKIPATYRRSTEQTRGIPFLNFWIKVEAGSADGEGTFDGYLPGGLTDGGSTIR